MQYFFCFYCSVYMNQHKGVVEPPAGGEIKDCVTACL